MAATSAENREISVRPLKGGAVVSKIRIPDALGVVDEPAFHPERGFGCFRIMTPEDGDKRVVWDSRDFTQIREAKEMFDKLVAEGLVPYKVGVNGKATAEVMAEFDPHAEEIIFLPIAAAVGG